MKLLGIDIGSYSVKAVEMDSAFGRYDVHEYYEQPIEVGSGAAEALSKLIHGLPRRPDRIAMAIPTGQMTFRNLRLPTRDKKAIRSAVVFELDDELPFSVGAGIYDYSVISQDKQGTYLHVAATLKRHLSSFLSFCQTGFADPDLLTTEAWAYRTLLNRLMSTAEQEKPVLLVQIGHQRTTLYGHWHGSPVAINNVPFGGRDFTLAISKHYAIPIDEAERAKIEHGFVIPAAQKESATPEQAEFSETLNKPLELLLSAIKQAGFTTKNATHQNVGMIYLSGGSSLLPGLAPVIEENIMVPVKPLQALSAVAASGVTYSERPDSALSLAASLALCLVGSERATAINFRKEEFSKRGQAKALEIATFKRPLIALGAVGLCLVLSLVVKGAVYGSRIKNVDALLEKNVRSFFGQLSSSAVRTYLSNTSTLRSSINKDLSKQRDINRLFGPSTGSPTDFLRQLSAGIPSDVVVDMIKFQAGASPTASFLSDDAHSASLTFTISNEQVAEKLASRISDKLGDFKRGTLEEVPASAGKPKQWKVTFSGKLLESAYGK